MKNLDVLYGKEAEYKNKSAQYEAIHKVRCEKEAELRGFKEADEVIK